MKKTTVTIGTVFSKAIAEKKAEKMASITINSFYNFEFTVYPVHGSFNLQASSDYDFEGDPEKAMLSILTEYLLLNI